MYLEDILKIFNECKELHKGCSKCPLSKSIIRIRTPETSYDICDCLIEIERQIKE